MRWSFVHSLSVSLLAFFGLLLFAVFDVQHQSSGSSSFGGSMSRPASGIYKGTGLQNEPSAPPLDPDSPSQGGLEGHPQEGQGTEEAKAGLEEKEIAEDSEGFAYTLVRDSAFGQPVWVPKGWQKEVSDETGSQFVRWTEPGGESFTKLQVTDASNVEEFKEIITSETKRFKRSSRYKFVQTRTRFGSDAYLGGAIWNFELQKEEGPWMKRAIAYFNSGGIGYALSTGYPKDAPKGTGRRMTAILNSLHEWQQPGP